jgi:hypothetical protein
MKVNYEAGVRPDTFHCLAEGVGRTSSALEKGVYPRQRSNFSTAHRVIDVTQGRALRRGEPGKLGIVWIQGLGSNPNAKCVQCNRRYIMKEIF